METCLRTQLHAGAGQVPVEGIVCRYTQCHLLCYKHFSPLPKVYDFSEMQVIGGNELPNSVCIPLYYSYEHVLVIGFTNVTAFTQVINSTANYTY